MSENVYINRGIKHDFPFINICKVPRRVLKTEGKARRFQSSRGTLRMLMNDKIMFDRYYCIKSANHCENEENIGALYFITSSHFPARVCFKKHACFGPSSDTQSFACGLRGASAWRLVTSIIKKLLHTYRCCTLLIAMY